MTDRATSRPFLLKQLKRRRVLCGVVMYLGAAFVVGCTAGSSPPAEPRLKGPSPPEVPESAPERRTEQVTLRRGAVTLSGTLEWPEGQAPVPAVLLVQGSAAFTRGNMGLFDTLAAGLAAARFASLRVDDRGVGGSGGVKHDLTTGGRVVGRGGASVTTCALSPAFATSELPARVLLTIGSLDAANLESVERLESVFRSRRYGGLVWQTQLFENETHNSAIPLSVSRGIHWLYGDLAPASGGGAGEGGTG